MKFERNLDAEWGEWWKKVEELSKKAPSKRPFMLVTDDDGHWYVIPASKQEEWDRLCDSYENEGWETPEYAVEVGGSPRRVKFHYYTIEGGL